MPTPVTKCVILARFSPRRDVADCESNEMQLEYCLKYAAAKGYEVVAHFEDMALSGDDCERPGLWAAIDMMKRGMVLLVWRRDRLARDPYLHELLEREARRGGVAARLGHGGNHASRGGWTIEAVTGSPNGSEPQDELVRGILANVDKYERRMTAIRTHYAMLRHQENGRAMSSIPPLGKIRGPDVVVEVNGQKRVRRTLVVDEKEQAVVERILREWKAGASLRKICRSLMADEIPTKAGAKIWKHQTVAAVLRRNGFNPGERGVGLAAPGARKRARA